jgi:GNAT superfamily N-acetyltransferase
LLNEDNAVYVMEFSSNEISGWVHVHGRLLIEAYPFAEIGGLVVDNNHRRKGIGENLIRKCEEWARKKGYQEIRVRSNGQRKEAHEFYKRIGFENLKWQEVYTFKLSE